MSSRDDILNKIAGATSKGNLFDLGEPDWEKNELKSTGSDLKETFKTQLEKVSGIFRELSTPEEFIAEIKQLLKENEFAETTCSSKSWSEQLNIQYKKNADNNAPFVIPCEALIASTASVLVSSNSGGSRKNHVFPPVLIVVATKDQLVPYFKDGLERLRSVYHELPSMISILTGPSRTADIEKTLVLGAHGPEKLIVFLLPGN